MMKKKAIIVPINPPTYEKYSSTLLNDRSEVTILPDLRRVNSAYGFPTPAVIMNDELIN